MRRKVELVGIFVGGLLLGHVIYVFLFRDLIFPGGAP